MAKSKKRRAGKKSSKSKTKRAAPARKRKMIAKKSKTKSRSIKAKKSPKSLARSTARAPRSPKEALISTFKPEPSQRPSMPSPAAMGIAPVAPGVSPPVGTSGAPGAYQPFSPGGRNTDEGD